MWAVGSTTAEDNEIRRTGRNPGTREAEPKQAQSQLSVKEQLKSLEATKNILASANAGSAALAEIDARIAELQAKSGPDPRTIYNDAASYLKKVKARVEAQRLQVQTLKEKLAAAEKELQSTEAAEQEAQTIYDRAVAALAQPSQGQSSMDEEMPQTQEYVDTDASLKEFAAFQENLASGIDKAIPDIQIRYTSYTQSMAAKQDTQVLPFEAWQWRELSAVLRAKFAQEVPGVLPARKRHKSTAAGSKQASQEGLPEEAGIPLPNEEDERL